MSEQATTDPAVDRAMKSHRKAAPVCPVLMLSTAPARSACVGDHCAWWIHGEDGKTDSQRCAVAVLAVRMGDLETLASAVEGIERH